MNSRAYIGQFSRSGDLFVCGFQERRIRVYEVEHNWRLRKEISCRNLRWTITDTAISPVRPGIYCSPPHRLPFNSINVMCPQFYGKRWQILLATS